MSGVAPLLADTFDVSNTAVSPLVMQFGGSVEEMTAITKLKSNFPRARVVDFSAYDRIVAFKGPIIYVGHSSVEGVQYYGKIVSWDVLAEMISISKSNNHCMLRCEANKIMELTEASGKQVFAFDQKIDAIFGANIVSMLISFSKFYWLNRFVRYKKIVLDPSVSLFLAWSNSETAYHGFTLVAGLATVIFPLTMRASSDFSNKIGAIALRAIFWNTLGA